jgi:hypothetical protein
MTVNWSIINKNEKEDRQWERIQGGCYIVISEEHFAANQVYT